VNHKSCRQIKSGSDPWAGYHATRRPWLRRYCPTLGWLHFPKLAGAVITGSQVRFGDLIDDGKYLVPGADNTGQGNFNLVRLEVVPEPATLTLLSLGAVGLLLRRRR
jgi:PEP-CTERM motif-containing protein